MRSGTDGRSPIDNQLSRKWMGSETDAGVFFLDTYSQSCELAFPEREEKFEHNSNHIRWMINIRKGTYSQGCYSEKREGCRGWSDPKTIDPIVLEKAQGFLVQEDETFFSDSDEEDDFIDFDEDGNPFWNSAGTLAPKDPPKVYSGTSLLGLTGLIVPQIEDEAEKKEEEEEEGEEEEEEESSSSSS